MPPHGRRQWPTDLQSVFLGVCRVGPPLTTLRKWFFTRYFDVTLSSGHFAKALTPQTQPVGWWLAYLRAWQS
jgi:hypothetical protein